MLFRIEKKKQWLTYFLDFLIQAGWSTHLFHGRSMKSAMRLKVVRDSAKLTFGDMMVVDYGLVVFSPE